MAIRGSNIFALLQDSDDEDKPAPKVAPAAAANKPAKSGPVSLPPAPPKPDPRPAQDPVAEAAKPQTRAPEKKAKPVQDDRHSKTGRGKEMKKDGQGAHNWGAEPVGKKQGPNAGGGRDKPTKSDLPDPVEPDVPEAEDTEGEKEVPAVPASEPKPDPKKPEEPDFIKLRREEEEKARKEAESFRTYKEYLGAEDQASEDKPKANSLLGFMGAEGGRGGRGRGRGRRQESERKAGAAPNLSDQFAFPKLG